MKFLSTPRDDHDWEVEGLCECIRDLVRVVQRFPNYDKLPEGVKLHLSAVDKKAAKIKAGLPKP